MRHHQGQPATPQLQSWDAAALLNPKAAVSAQQAAPPSLPSRQPSNGPHFTNSHAPQVSFQFSTPDATENFHSHPPRPSMTPGGIANPRQSTPNGMSLMIERMNNVQDRSTVPVAKRRRIADDSQGHPSRNGFHGNGGGGILSGYVKQKQEEGRVAPSTTPRSQGTVDLTGGDDDDDDLVEVKEPREQEVCYGMIGGALVNCHIVPSPKPGSRTLVPGSWPQVKVVLRRMEGDRSMNIEVYDHTRTTIGKLDPRTAHGLAPLLDASMIALRTDAMIGIRRRLPGEEAGKAISKSYPLQLMVYGKFKYAKAVGSNLEKAGLNLLSPTRVDQGVRVFNPLAKENRPTAAPRTYANPAPPPVARTEEEIRSDVLTVFDSLKETEDLPEQEPDDRILTPLLKHQKQALHFMTGREDTSNMVDELWQERTDARGQLTYCNVITNEQSRRAPVKAQGGILADMMGLGKTLSILSLVTSTVHASLQWAQAEPVVHSAGDKRPPRQLPDSFAPPKPESLGLTKPKKNSKATLLICPLSTVTNWEEQIKQHVRPNSLSYHIYHGPHRIKDSERLADYDLVITTYGSVSSELNARFTNKRGPHPLEDIGWFRIVLDEAHMIREQSTLQFKAICRLQANRRWAVTGTPVQNKLDDLSALLAFLRIKPFDDRTKFNQYIVAPFKLCDPNIVPKLRILVDTITLRRQKDKIDLPKRYDKIVKLQFSSDERRMYDAFEKDAQVRVSVLAGQRERMVGGKTYIHILQAILRLRLFCSGGKHLLNEDDLRLLEGLTQESPIDLDSDNDDDKQALTENQAYEMFNLMRDTNGDNCIGCNQKLGAKEGADIESERQEEVIGHMTPCFHLVCTSCIKEIEDICACGLALQGLVALRLTRTNQEHDAHAEARSRDASGGKGIKDYSGPNTKVRYLIEELKKWRNLGEAKPDEPPYKSVVFSQWTTNLDLIQLALDAERIAFVRLDGKMSRTARTRAMDNFREDPNVQVILVSITAGGLGLNLTTGNSVYIMEPLFNPAAEAQAIDRVHRLGQKREVHCVRLLMEASFEEKMRVLQEKKMKLASLSMDREKGVGSGQLSKSEAAKQRLMDLRSLFK
ncbi:SNF2 family domain-containing protein [Diaporthe helianthi]|uniref:SNF2 family domain-containing protein n=1 Tax=Diaporthe helianthi TaxID=158607 RepID=A0A2P5IDH7_DIAHE|nr:SNF2 family domain-containing protein [Diaporthe helianthi]